MISKTAKVTKAGKKSTAQEQVAVAAAAPLEGWDSRVIVLDDVRAANYGLLRITLEGTAPLLVHRFPEKTRIEIEEKQQGRASAARKKAPRDPEQDFIGSLHVIGVRPRSAKEITDNPTRFRWGIPATAFKQAVVRVGALNELMPMTQGRVALHVRGDAADRELVELHSPAPPVMHTGMVRIQQTSDVRYRALFEQWSVTLDVDFHARLISGEQLVSLFVDAGIGNGVGDWRPAGRSSSGTFGTWRVTAASVKTPVLR